MSQGDDPLPPDLEDEAAAYALGALEGEDRTRFEAALSRSGALRRRVAEYRESAAHVGLGLPPSTPSPGSKAALMARISGAGPGAVGGGAGPGLLPWGLAGALAVVTLALGVVALDAKKSAGQASDRAEGAAAEAAGARRLMEAESQRSATLIQASAEERARAEALRAERERLRAERDDLTAERDRLRREFDGVRGRLERVEAMLRDPRLESKPLAPAGPLVGTPAGGRVLWTGSDVLVIGHDLPPLGPNESYQLWAIHPGATLPGPVFSGPGPDGALTGLHTFDRAASGAVFGISKESSPTGAAPGEGPGTVVLVSP